MAGLFDPFTGQSGKDAANAQIGGITAGYNTASGALNQGNTALTTNYANALAPFTQNYGTATKGVGALTDALGITGDPSQVQAKLAATPGYQFTLNQGNENVLRNQARTGALNSGATNLDLQAQGQGLANQTYQQYVSNLQPFLGASNSAAGGIAGVNQNLGNALNANANTQAQLGYTAATGVGNANANADLAAGKGISNLWNAGMNVAGMVAGLPPGTLGSFGGTGGNSGGPQNLMNGQGGGAGFGVNGEQLPGNFTAQSPFGYAQGGKPPVGQLAIVGEKGPELFVPDQPGTVVPNTIAQKLLQFMPRQSNGGPAQAAFNPSTALARFLRAA